VVWTNAWILHNSVLTAFELIYNFSLHNNLCQCLPQFKQTQRKIALSPFLKLLPDKIPVVSLVIGWLFVISWDMTNNCLPIYLSDCWAQRTSWLGKLLSSWLPEIKTVCQGKDRFGLPLLLILFFRCLFLTTVASWTSALTQQDSYNAASSVA